MPSRKRTPRHRLSVKTGKGGAYLELLRNFQLFAQLDTKIVRARSHDTPVLYAHVLPGLDVLLCTVRGAQPPYPDGQEARTRCIEAITDALEQPLDGLERGGHWYETNGLGFLVFASDSRIEILREFGALHIIEQGDTVPRQAR